MISNATGNVTISATCVLITYSIVATITNGTYTGSSTIASGGTEEIVLTANTYYEITNNPTITNCSSTLVSSTSTSRTYSLSSPTGNVTITLTCTPSRTLVAPSVTLNDDELVITDNDGNADGFKVYWDDSTTPAETIPNT